MSLATPSPAAAAGTIAESGVTSTSSAAVRIGVLLGSARVNGNAAGLLAFVRSRLSQVAASAAVELVGIGPPTLGPVVDPVMPAALFDSVDTIDPTKYTSEATQAWSAKVHACQALVFLSPQFNWGIPGELKNSLDHLYWEWRGKPAVLITYGGHGGGKCAEALRTVCEGGLKMKLLPVERDVRITLPRPFIMGDERVQATSFEKNSSSLPAAFLAEYQDAIDTALTELLVQLCS